METKAKQTKQAILIDVPQGKLDVSPLKEFFFILSPKELITGLRRLQADSYSAYARSLEGSIQDESTEGICKDHLNDLYDLGVLIEHLEKCSFIKEKAA